MPFDDENDGSVRGFGLGCIYTCHAVVSLRPFIEMPKELLQWLFFCLFCCLPFYLFCFEESFSKFLRIRQLKAINADAMSCLVFVRTALPIPVVSVFFWLIGNEWAFCCSNQTFNTFLASPTPPSGPPLLIAGQFLCDLQGRPGSLFLQYIYLYIYVYVYICIYISLFFNFIHIYMCLYIYVSN